MDHYNILLYFGILLFLFHILTDYTHISILAIILIVIGYSRWYISTTFYVFLIVISILDIGITIIRWFINYYLKEKVSSEKSKKKLKENLKDNKKEKGKKTK
jgi:membrane protein implicated in regulation of membrane protease activity